MRKLLFLLIFTITIFVNAGCNKSDIAFIDSNHIEETQAANAIAAAEQLSLIHTECKIATLECRYNNVAKSVLPKGKGIFHLGEKDRTFWIEYKGIIYLGIDANDLQINVDGYDVFVYVPDAQQVMAPDIDQNYLNGENIVLSKDGFNKNRITAANQFKAINDAQNNMSSSNERNKGLYAAAKNIAKNQIREYIDSVGKQFDITYNIHWSDVPLFEKD